MGRMGQNECWHKKIIAAAKQQKMDMYNVLKVKRKTQDSLWREGTWNTEVN